VNVLISLTLFIKECYMYYSHKNNIFKLWMTTIIEKLIYIIASLHFFILLTIPFYFTTVKDACILLTRANMSLIKS